MQLWLAVTAVHGLTDVFAAPMLAVQTQLASGVAVAILPDHDARLSVLIPFSICHMRRDYGSLKTSAAVHAIWLSYPPLAAASLALYHTPMHYYKTYEMTWPRLKNNDRHASLMCCLAATILCYLLLPEYDDPAACDAMWVAPVIGHIVFTELIDKPFKK